ncbi:DNA repair protein RecN [Corynebacterium coyleae]|uniref:DNA repair protein RecN n=1 Tax=Corynebacterium coyleae TaxID=53374 RepID=UPI000C762A8D|nr:DNA repair protein RecN [Corynebacterium coyleae]MDK8663155.1 DNA repair protein RecN [Corynebacterium coyleae]MDK8705799.1 DNA repair protein RecN [Corynebacterium coyleae]MDK8733114.1 DNA repair protein RecN [Corynebacterium coyleae]MDK8891840.1 DNA repair protein RecN [Corynebacterium coyleae]PLA37857.1 DNA repair protein RecN [Corynebacterium coyleae]
MLAEIAISNLGVIRHASAELAPGLTVLTGETGAGKTMVVTGLRLLTGGRADASRVRTGAQEAVVEGALSIADLPESTLSAVHAIAEGAGAGPDENGEYVVSRAVKATGRSSAHLGGRKVPAATLGDLAGHLLTIHGQNDQLRLLAPEQQLAALDRFEPAIAQKLSSYRDVYVQWREASKDLKDRTEKRLELAQEMDRLRFAIEEIDAVAPVDGEDADLVATINRLQDVDALREAAQTALVAIDGAEAVGGYSAEAEEAASDLVGRAQAALVGASDEELRELGVRLGEVAGVLADVSAELGSFTADLPTDPDELERLLQRQQELKGLTRKYAPDIAGVLAWREKAGKRLSKIDTSEEAIDELKRRVADLEAELKKRAAALTKARNKAAKNLGEAVTEELHGLAMPKAQLRVELAEAKFGRDGADAVEITLAPNSALEPKPLATSASGGELSRVMLALEVILSESSAGGTLVFDEVDAGVGGRAAVEIGRRLARLALRHQVIVVTHLPQVAAYANTHLHVSKDVGDEAVTSGVGNLTDEQRIEELARMMAGLDDSDTGRAHAAELFKRAQREVEEMRA